MQREVKVRLYLWLVHALFIPSKVNVTRQLPLHLLFSILFFMLPLNVFICAASIFCSYSTYYAGFVVLADFVAFRYLIH